MLMSARCFSHFSPSCTQPLLRIGEVTQTPKANHNRQAKNVYLERAPKGHHITINMASCKFSKAKLTPMHIKQNSSEPLICPVRAFTRYLRVSPKSAYVFCHSDSKPLTARFVRERLSHLLWNANLNALHYNTHSFRIGKATDMYTQGASDVQI